MLNRLWKPPVALGFVPIVLAMVSVPNLAFGIGGDQCGDATDLTPLLQCDGMLYVDPTMGIPTATASGGPAGRCWFSGDGVQNDRWYTWTNSSADKVWFNAWAEHFGVDARAQIAVYGDCSGMLERACEDRGENSVGALLQAFIVDPGETLYIQFDGREGDRQFDRAGFQCVRLGMSESCDDAIDLGTLSPDLTAPVVDRSPDFSPVGSSTYAEVEPYQGRLLDQPETCYQFRASEDGWMQFTATPVSNNARVTLSRDASASWEVSEFCWKGFIVGSAPQHGAAVSPGETYCLCLDSYDEPFATPFGWWRFEVHFWPKSTATNVDCATAEPVDLCTTRTVTYRNLSTAGTGDVPGIPPYESCTDPPTWWACAGYAQDLHYSLEWHQGMVDCGCTGYRVTQGQPVVPGVATVCDAATQIGTGCPIDLSNCVANQNQWAHGGRPEDSVEVTGLGQSDVGTVYHIQLDGYMVHACPDFDATFELLGCDPACTGDICSTCIPIVPTGNVDNALIARRLGDDVELFWLASTVRPSNHVVFRTSEKAEVAQTQVGIGNEERLATLAGTRFTDVGAVPTAPDPTFYQVLPADSCNEPVYP